MRDAAATLVEASTRAVPLTRGKLGGMPDRYRTPDGWTVEVVQLSGTHGRDGQWLRVRYRSYFVADVRSVGELEQWFPLADLEPDGLSAAA